MNLNAIYLDEHKGVAFSPSEIAGCLEHGILNKTQLLMVIAARVAGFDHVAAGACLRIGVNGHPQALAEVVRIFEQTQPERFESLVDEVIAMIGERGVKAAWARHKQAHAVAPTDVLIGINSKIQSLALEKPFSAHQRDRAARRFESLIESKRPQGNAPKFASFDHISH
jgi:hypothetical protein